MKSKKDEVFRCPVVMSAYVGNCRRAAQNCLAGRIQSAGRMLPTPGLFERERLLLDTEQYLMCDSVFRGEECCKIA